MVQREYPTGYTLIVANTDRTADIRDAELPHVIGHLLQLQVPQFLADVTLRALQNEGVGKVRVTASTMLNDFFNNSRNPREIRIEIPSTVNPNADPPQSAAGTSTGRVSWTDPTPIRGRTVRVASDSQVGGYYEVTMVAGRATDCTCPNHDPDKGNNPYCKHMRRADAQERTANAALR